MAFRSLLTFWNPNPSSLSSSGSTFCLPSRWWEGMPSSRCCFRCLRYCSTSFLISRHSSALTHRVVHWATHASVIAVGRLTGARVTSVTSAPTCRSSSCGGGSSSQRLVVAAVLLLVLVFVFIFAATSLGGNARIGLATLPASGAGGLCHARPSVALTHLSARVKSSATSWMSCVVSFSNIFTSLTPWRNASTTEALAI
jgi:hypothetical protein